MNKVWVYQADRFLSDSEVTQMQERLDDFVTSWTAHGSDLVGKGSFLQHLFLILEVDEAQAGVTGCSIDKSVHFIKSLGNEFAVDFFNRTKIAYLDATGNIQLVNRDKFEALIQEEAVTKDTIVYNNLILDAAQLETTWEVPLRESWHEKVFF